MLAVRWWIIRRGWNATGSIPTGGVADAVRDQVQFCGAVARGHLQQFDAVADRADRADQIVADA